MNRKLSWMVLVLASVTSFSACTGWDDSKEGNLKVHESVTFVDKSGSSHSLVSGPASFEFKNGLFGIYNPSLKIRMADGSTSEIEVPRKNFTGDVLDLSPSELHQPYGIHAEKERRLIEAWNTTGLETCQKAGYCYQYLPSGKYEYQFGPACSGLRSVERRAERIRERLSIHLMQSNAEVAVFESSSEKEWVNSSQILSAGFCF
jgi:hypothetical protein